MDLLQPKAMLVKDSLTREWGVLHRTPTAAGRIRSSRGKKTVAAVLLGGLLLPGVLYGAWQYAAGQVSPNPASQNQDARVVTTHALPSQIPSQPSPSTAFPEASALTATAAPATQNGRIEIPKIGVAMALVEGRGEETMLRGAWRFPHASTPDKGGNTVIVGHRFLNLPPNPETFYSLDKISQGDTFAVEWNGETYRYRVTETKVVPPTDLSVLEQTVKPTVTLITCTPVFTTKNRLIVHAERIG